jgi:hypothetical protein
VWRRAKYFSYIGPVNLSSELVELIAISRRPIIRNMVVMVSKLEVNTWATRREFKQNCMTKKSEWALTFFYLFI